MAARFCDYGHVGIVRLLAGIGAQLRQSRTLTAAIILLLVAAWSVTWAHSLGKSAAPLRADPAIVDLGKVRQGSEASIEVVLKNESHSTANIDRTVTSCGCAVTAIERRVLGPGQTSKLTLNWELGSRRRDAGLTALVKYRLQGAGPQRSLRIPISAFVEPQMTVTPSQLTVSSRKEQERKVIVVNRSNGWADGVLTKTAVTHESLDATILHNDPITGRAEVSVCIRPSTSEQLSLVDRSIVLFFENAIDTSVKVPVIVTN